MAAFHSAAQRLQIVLASDLNAARALLRNLARRLRVKGGHRRPDQRRLLYARKRTSRAVRLSFLSALLTARSGRAPSIANPVMVGRTACRLDG